MSTELSEDFEDYGPWKFSEAPAEVQEKAIERWRDNNYDFDGAEYVIDDFKEQMAERGIKVDEVHYNFKSVSRSHDSCYFEDECEDWRNLIDFDSDDLRYHVLVATNEFDKADDELTDLAADAKTIFKNAMREVYKDLEAAYDYESSDEYIKETMEANDYTIDEEGDIV